MKLIEAVKAQHFKVTALPSEHAKATALIEEGIFAGSILTLVARSYLRGPVAVSIHGTMFSMPYELACDLEGELVA